MALVVADRVQETTTTTGTGTYTLAGAKAGFQSFGAVGDGNTTYYACTDGTDYEVGIGTYTATGTTLARTTIIESSNSDLAVSWGAGSKDIFVTSPADKTLLVGRNLYVDNPSSATMPSATGTNAFAIGSGAISAGNNSAALGNSRAGAASSIAGAINNNSSSYGTTGVNTVSFGTQSRATNNSAVSIGQSSIASGYQSAAYGYNAVASGQDSFAGGSTTDATATNSTALGKNAQATHANATAVGYNAATSATNQVALGASGYAVRISSAYTLPTSDGTNGQVLTTDGAGAVTFADAGGGAFAYTIDNKTAAYTVVSGDLGKIINCSSGTFTISLTSAATLGAGWYCWIYNTDDGASNFAVTIDPDGSETIGFKSTIVLRQLEGVKIVSDGTNWLVGDDRKSLFFQQNYRAGFFTPPSATGLLSTAIGRGATSSAGDSFAAGSGSAGSGAKAAGSGSVVLGNAYSSGSDGFAAAIANNTSSYGATGANSVAMGKQAKATSTSAVAIGESNSASNLWACSIGGYQNIVSGGASIGGYQNSVTQNYAIAVGGYQNTASNYYTVATGRSAVANIRGKIAHASDRFSANGDAQTGTFIIRSDTTDATAEALTSNNGTASTDNQIILPNNSAYSFSGTIIARQDAASGSNYASWEIKGALLRDANAASTVLGNGIVNKLYATAGASAWAVALTADTTNGGLKVEVTGAAATNIRWVATVNTSEVTYA